MAVAALTLAGGSVSTARAESGAFITGGRLAFNYSNIAFNRTDRYGNTYAVGYSDGGYGVEAGLQGRYAVVEGQMGVNIGANFIYRTPFYYYNGWSGKSWNSNEMAISVPLLFEVSPSTFGANSSSVYEIIFFQIGVQADYVFNYAETYDNKSRDEDNMLWGREKVNVGLVIGAVGYFNSHCSLDLRYLLGLTSFDKDDKKSYLYSGSLGLSFYL